MIVLKYLTAPWLSIAGISARRIETNNLIGATKTATTVMMTFWDIFYWMKMIPFDSNFDEFAHEDYFDSNDTEHVADFYLKHWGDYHQGPDSL